MCCTRSDEVRAHRGGATGEAEETLRLTRGWRAARCTGRVAAQLTLNGLAPALSPCSSRSSVRVLTFSHTLRVVTPGVRRHARVGGVQAAEKGAQGGGDYVRRRPWRERPAASFAVHDGARGCVCARWPASRVAAQPDARAGCFRRAAAAAAAAAAGDKMLRWQVSSACSAAFAVGCAAFIARAGYRATAIKRFLEPRLALQTARGPHHHHHPRRWPPLAP